jgi:hypothetical protein
MRLDALDPLLVRLVVACQARLRLSPYARVPFVQIDPALLTPPLVNRLHAKANTARQTRQGKHCRSSRTATRRRRGVEPEAVERRLKTTESSDGWWCSARSLSRAWAELCGGAQPGRRQEGLPQDVAEVPSGACMCGCVLPPPLLTACRTPRSGPQPRRECRAQQADVPGGERGLQHALGARAACGVRRPLPDALRAGAGVAHRGAAA